MSQKKTTPVGLYFKELRRCKDNKCMDIVTASGLYKKLNAQEKEYYSVLAKKINEKHSLENVGYTTQKDTIGLNLKEVTECQDRITTWEQDMLSKIKNISEKSDVMERYFVAVEVAGVYFSRPDDPQAGYATSEITFIRFNFKNGIKDTLIVFPECVKVSIGYRESLYEDLEEAVGWRPDTFKNNHSLVDCRQQIRDFFRGIYDPIFVASKGFQEAVAMSLYNLYDEIGERCPWIYSLQDWGKHCTIYRLDSLVSNIINRKCSTKDRNEHFGPGDVREHWMKVNANTASKCCERHLQYGLSNQCPHDLVTRNLYSSFLLMYTLYRDEMQPLQDMVGEDFFCNLDLILADDESSEGGTQRQRARNGHSSVYWNNYVLNNKSGIEDVIDGITAITVSENGNRAVPTLDRVPFAIGRGRGVTRQSEKMVVPGELDLVRKLKLPSVIC